MESLYEIKVRTLQGDAIELSRYRGKVLLIVNVASRCGFTPQYKELQELHEKYEARGFEVLAFPCNDFANQEPGDETEISSFCKDRFGTRFPLFGKVRILGEAAHPLYRFLQEKNPPLTASKSFMALAFNCFKAVYFSFKGMRPRSKNAVQWNFQKFLIDKRGQPAANFASEIKPLDPQLTRQIEKELAN